jgi:hypothetical protein
VQEDHGIRVAGAFVDIVDAKRAPLPFAVWNLDVVGFEGIAREVLEALVGRAQDLHRLDLGGAGVGKAGG